MSRARFLFVVAVGASFLVCCAPLQSGADRRELGKPDTASSDGGDGSVVDTAEDAEDAGAEVDAPIEAGPCPLDLTSVPIVDVPPTLTTDTHWDCHVRYRLTTVTYVISPATLTISAGTNIVANLESALVVTRGAKLVAEGAATSPIVFSSSPVTGRHTPGGWGGLLLLGDALTNAGDVPLGALGGPTSPDARARYGGTNDAGSCGTLRYVRIEFAGDILPGAVQNSPGLGLAGCGSGTVVDFVQTHLTLDTAIKVWGGSVGLRHVVATRSYGDAIHLTAGFHGRMQFVVAQNDPARDGRGLVLANNDASAKWSAVPRTTPLLYNATFIGAHERASRRADAVVFTRGGFGRIFDSIFLGYGGQAAEFTDEPTGVSDVPAIYGTPDRTDIESSDWYQNGADDSTYFTSAGDAGVDSGSAPEPATYFGDPSRKNLFGMDPNIHNAYVLTAPSFALSKGSSAVMLKGAAPPPVDDTFFVRKAYFGAVAPLDEEPDWTLTWTLYPPN